MPSQKSPDVGIDPPGIRTSPAGYVAAHGRYRVTMDVGSLSLRIL